MPEKIRNVTAVPTVGIVIKVGAKVPMILPTVLNAPSVPTVLPLSSRLSVVYFTSDGVKYANTGIVSMDDGIGAAQIIDNRTDKKNYVGQTASFSVLSVTVNGYVYSMANTDPSML